MTVGAQQPSVGTGNYGSPKRAILLADDNLQLREMLGRYLEAAGYPVFQASDGKQALSLWHCHSSEIAVLVTDVDMPQLSGPQLANELRRTCPDLPVVMITGLADTAQVSESRYSVLPKPFGGRDLKNRIAALLGAR